MKNIDIEDKPFDKKEKHILSVIDLELYSAYRCEKHGVFAKIKTLDGDFDYAICKICGKLCRKISNALELQNKFKMKI